MAACSPAMPSYLSQHRDRSNYHSDRQDGDGGIQPLEFVELKNLKAAIV